MSKICNFCAQELPDNAVICDFCGEQLNVSANNNNAEIQQQISAAQPKSNPSAPVFTQSQTQHLYQSQFQPQSQYQFQSAQPQQSQPQNFAASQIKIKSTGIIIKIIAVVLAVLFFFPMFTVSCSGGFGAEEKIPFSGLDCAIGKDIGSGMGGKSESNPSAWLLFIVPVILLAVFWFKINEAIKYLVGTGLSCVGLIMFFIFYLEINKKGGEGMMGMIKINFSVAFYGSVVLYIISGILCLIVFLNKKSMLNSPQLNL